MANNRATLQHRIEYLGWMLVSGALKLIPRRVMIIAADGIGWVLYHVLKIRRDTIDEQLQIAFGADRTPEQLRQMGCESWQNCVLTFFEFLQPNPIGSAGWDEFRSEEGFEEYCRPLLDAGQTAIVITGHMGNWEALGQLGTRENVQLAAVAKAMHNPLVNNAILKSRADRGLEVLQIKTNMKSIVDGIKQGKWVAIVGDQDARRRGLFVDFFGVPSSTAPGAAHFAYTMNKPLLPAFCVRVRDKQRHLKIVCAPLIYPNPEADKDEELLRLTQEHTRALEWVIRRFPSDYFWLHRRWKTRPKKKKPVAADE